MRNKASLTLLELAVMLLVFALAAVLCLRAFVWADAASKESAARDRAWIQAQNAAEVLKGCGGDMEEAAGMFGGAWDGAEWAVCYNEDWDQTDAEHTYTLRAVSGDSGVEHLGQAAVSVCQDDLELAALEVCWQEVSGDG